MKNPRLFLVPIAVACAVGFLLGLLNTATPMSQIAVTSTCAGSVTFALMTLLRGNRAQSAADAASRAYALQFQAAPGTAAVYVFRDGFYGKFLGLDVGLNGRGVGQTRGGTFFRIDALPGHHALSAYNPQDRTTAELPLMLTEGEVAFVELKLGMTGKPARQSLTRTDPAQAMPRVRRCRMLAQAAPIAATA